MQLGLEEDDRLEAPTCPASTPFHSYMTYPTHIRTYVAVPRRTHDTRELLVCPFGCIRPGLPLCPRLVRLFSPFALPSILGAHHVFHFIHIITACNFQLCRPLPALFSFLMLFAPCPRRDVYFKCRIPSRDAPYSTRTATCSSYAAIESCPLATAKPHMSFHKCCIASQRAAHRAEKKKKPTQAGNLHCWCKP